MKTKSTKRTSDSRDAKIAELELSVAKLSKQRSEMEHLWMEEMKKSGPAIGNAMKVPQLQKQLRVIEHIAAGRKDEAILDILTPLPLLFGIDVRFADDKTRMAAEDELLHKVVGIVSDNLKQLTVKRDIEVIEKGEQQ